jgi:hypothetical protein
VQAQGDTYLEQHAVGGVVSAKAYGLFVRLEHRIGMNFFISDANFCGSAQSEAPDLDECIA